MGNLFGMLGMGARALSVHSGSIEVLGNNVANAATPGYHRQSLLMKTSPSINGYGQGVMSAGIGRSFNRFVESQVLTQTSTTRGYEMEAQALYVVDGIFDETQVSGLSGSLDAFYASLNDLVTNPSDVSARQTVLSKAQGLTRRFNDLSSSLQQVQRELDNQITTDVSQVNSLAKQIADLNREITTREGSGQTAGNLRDQRDLALNALSELTPIVVEEQQNGATTVLVNGLTLVAETKANHLVTDKDGTNGATQIYFELKGGERINITNSIETGRIGGAVEVRGGYIDSYSSDLDSLAFDMATALNAIHSVGYGTDGVTGRNLFDVSATATGAAASISLSEDVLGNPDALAAALDPNYLPGDNENAIALYQSREAGNASLGDMTFSGFYTTLATQIGTDARSAADQYAIEESQLFEIAALKESQSGVNIDEEAAELQKFEAAYQAAAKYVSAVKDMLDVLMRM